MFNNDYAFEIADYQLPYAWEIDQANELLDDLLTALENDDGVMPIDELDPYFLGSIVLIKGDAPDSEVVDGQQRLTTLTLLLATLRSMVPSKFAQALTNFLYQEGDPILGTHNRYRLKPRKRDRDFFQRYAQDEGGIDQLITLDPAPLTDSQRNYHTNAKLFKERLSAQPESKRVRLLQFIINRCFLVVVSTPDLERLAAGLMITRVLLNDRLRRYGQLLAAIEQHQDLCDTASPLQLIDAECSQILSALNGDVYQLKPRLYILLRLDAALADRGATYDHGIISVEHVLPQNPPTGSTWYTWFPERECRLATPGRKRYEYDPRLDPQLVWADKAEHLTFNVEAVLLHIHEERVAPCAIVESIRTLIDVVKNTQLR